jgi:hypothetical protein
MATNQRLSEPLVNSQPSRSDLLAMNQIFEGAFLIDGGKIELRPSSILNRKKTLRIWQKTITKRWA